MVETENKESEPQAAYVFGEIIKMYSYREGKIIDYIIFGVLDPSGNFIYPNAARILDMDGPNEQISPYGGGLPGEFEKSDIMWDIQRMTMALMKGYQTEFPDTPIEQIQETVRKIIKNGQRRKGQAAEK